MVNLLHKRFFCALIITTSFLTLSGCGMLFSSNHQKITLQSSTKDASIKFQKEAEAKNSKKVKVEKTSYYYTAQVSKPGYKTSNYAFQLHKRSPTYAFTILNLAIPIYGWFYGIPLDLMTPKTRKFDKIQKIPALTPYEPRKSDEKYMLVHNTSIDAKGTDIIWHNYFSINKFKNDNHQDSRSVRKQNKSKDKEDVKIDNTIFTSALNATMTEMNFRDTLSMFPNINNSLYLNATIKKVTFHYVTSKIAKNPSKQRYLGHANNLISIELQIDWDVLDYYKQSICTLKTDKKSDLFLISYSASESEYHQKIADAMEDNMDYSVMDIRKQLSDKGILKISNLKEQVIPAISIDKPVADPNKRINDFLKSSVTVKVDDGHGSGFVVSEDGYVITAYHVVAGSKKIEVILNDSDKVEAEVVRKNTEADLALLKIKKNGLSPLLLSQTTDPEIGIDVWAMGTPKTLELGKSVSKGILSGLRKANNVNYLQTDVSINHGNSGGALISKDGTVLGVVTSKLEGVGIEGVGFAISSQEIFNKLKLAYK